MPLYTFFDKSLSIVRRSVICHPTDTVFETSDYVDVFHDKKDLSAFVVTAPQLAFVDNKHDSELSPAKRSLRMSSALKLRFLLHTAGRSVEVEVQSEFARGRHRIEMLPAAHRLANAVQMKPVDCCFVVHEWNLGPVAYLGLGGLCAAVVNAIQPPHILEGLVISIQELCRRSPLASPRFLGELGPPTRSAVDFDACRAALRRLQSISSPSPQVLEHCRLISQILEAAPTPAAAAPREVVVPGPLVEDEAADALSRESVAEQLSPSLQTTDEQPPGPTTFAATIVDDPTGEEAARDVVPAPKTASPGMFAALHARVFGNVLPRTVSATGRDASSDRQAGSSLVAEKESGAVPSNAESVVLEKEKEFASVEDPALEADALLREGGSLSDEPSAFVLPRVGDLISDSGSLETNVVVRSACGAVGAAWETILGLVPLPKWAEGVVSIRSEEQRADCTGTTSMLVVTVDDPTALRDRAVCAALEAIGLDIPATCAALPRLLLAGSELDFGLFEARQPAGWWGRLDRRDALRRASRAVELLSSVVALGAFEVPAGENAFTAARLFTAATFQPLRSGTVTPRPAPASRSGTRDADWDAPRREEDGAAATPASGLDAVAIATADAAARETPVSSDGVSGHACQSTGATAVLLAVAYARRAAAGSRCGPEACEEAASLWEAPLWPCRVPPSMMSLSERECASSFAVASFDEDRANVALALAAARGFTGLSLIDVESAQPVLDGNRIADVLSRVSHRATFPPALEAVRVQAADQGIGTAAVVDPADLLWARITAAQHGEVFVPCSRARGAAFPSAEDDIFDGDAASDAGTEAGCLSGTVLTAAELPDLPTRVQAVPPAAGAASGGVARPARDTNVSVLSDLPEVPPQSYTEWCRDLERQAEGERVREIDEGERLSRELEAELELDALAATAAAAAAAAATDAVRQQQDAAAASDVLVMDRPATPPVAVPVPQDPAACPLPRETLLGALGHVVSRVLAGTAPPPLTRRARLIDNVKRSIGADVSAEPWLADLLSSPDLKTDGQLLNAVLNFYQ